MEGAVTRLVMLHCGDQSHRPFLEQVAEGDAAFLASLGGLQNEIEVVLDQSAIRGVAGRALRVEQAPLLVVGQAWIASQLGSVIGLFAGRRSRLSTLRHTVILRRPDRPARTMISS